MEKRTARGLMRRDRHTGSHRGAGLFPRLRGILRHACREPGNGPVLVGIASLLWLLLRSGMKPSRAAYPCQKAALAN
ncbi:MAG: hypothetical protein ABSB63_14475, partial [Spirochaetia bacterium]